MLATTMALMRMNAISKAETSSFSMHACEPCGTPDRDSCLPRPYEGASDASPFSLPACMPMTRSTLPSSKRDVLFGDEHRAVLEVDLQQRLHHAYADFRRQAERWLVGKVELGIGHQAATDRDHSPLAARQTPDRRLQAFAQRLEERQDAFLPFFSGPPGRPGERAGVEMLLDGQSLKESRRPAA